MSRWQNAETIPDGSPQMAQIHADFSAKICVICG
jgi:hypothetical protein